MSNLEGKSAWIELTDRTMPNFTIYGYHTGKLIQVRRESGLELKTIYQGWGLFGDGNGFQDVTHWRPN